MEQVSIQSEQKLARYPRNAEKVVPGPPAEPSKLSKRDKMSERGKLFGKPKAAFGSRFVCYIYRNQLHWRCLGAPKTPMLKNVQECPISLPTLANRKTYYAFLKPMYKKGGKRETARLEYRKTQGRYKFRVYF